MAVQNAAAGGVEGRAIYEGADDPAWRLAVYEPVHDGWAFTNMGGRPFLDALAARARLRPAARVLELCSGLGATSRYLAARYGTRVDGVELLPHLVNLARVEAERTGPPVSGLVRFEAGDVTRWRAAREYDVVFALESLVLVADLPAALRTAWAALRPGGRLFLGEVMAGPGLTQGLREALRRDDAMVSLLAPDDYPPTLTAAGLAAPRMEDRTALAAACFRRIRGAVRRHRDAILRLEGVAGLARWEELANLYWDGFGSRRLTYYWVETRRPLHSGEESDREPQDPRSRATVRRGS